MDTLTSPTTGLNARRPRFARWMSATNDVTRMFLAAGRIPGLINLAGGLPEPALLPARDFAPPRATRSRRVHRKRSAMVPSRACSSCATGSPSASVRPPCG